ncbi:hypothetical protein BDR07DRAFT_313797 [Suillus spraguei]|nr:hypothetical protein BDR07DRAFT_313797 [Suillus spraguei]
MRVTTTPAISAKEQTSWSGTRVIVSPARNILVPRGCLGYERYKYCDSRRGFHLYLTKLFDCCSWMSQTVLDDQKFQARNDIMMRTRRIQNCKTIIPSRKSPLSRNLLSPISIFEHPRLARPDGPACQMELLDMILHSNCFLGVFPLSLQNSVLPLRSKIIGSLHS